MTVDDRTRLNLHHKLDEVLGSEEADTLMAHLPPVTWSEVATKDDLRALATELRSEIRAVDANVESLESRMMAEFAQVRTEIAEGVARQIKWMVTFAAAWSTLLVTVVRLVP